MAEAPKFNSQFTGQQVETAIENGLLVPERTIITPDGARTTTVAVGGLSKGTTIDQDTNVADLLKKIIFAYQAFSLSCSSSPSSSAVYEKGTTVTVNSVSYSIGSGSDAVTSVELFRGSTSLSKKTSSIGTSGSFSLSEESTSAASPVTYTVTATDGTTTKSSSVKPCIFVDPFFYGVLSSNSTPSTNLSSIGTKDIKSSGNKTYTFTANNQHPFVAYPASYGNLKKIKDESGFDYISNFTKYTIDASVASGTVSYYVYVQSTAANVSNFKFTFEF
jgi:hypothetical protein